MKELEKEISTRKWKSECLEKFVMFLKELYKSPLKTAQRKNSEASEDARF